MSSPPQELGGTQFSLQQRCHPPGGILKCPGPGKCLHRPARPCGGPEGNKSAFLVPRFSSV